MDLIMNAFTGGLAWLGLALLAFKVFALIDAAIRPEGAYTAVDKQTKTVWLVILAIAVVFDFFDGVIGLFAIIGLIAAIVYVVDVRPALKQAGRGRGGSGQHMGPYGPW